MRLDAPVTIYVGHITCLWRSVFDGLILQVIQVDLDNPILVTVAGFKEFLRLFIRFGDHGKCFGFPSKYPRRNMCILIVVSDRLLSIDCLNRSQKRAHVSISPKNGSSLIGGSLIA